jgi:hypothetical protein
MWFTGRKQKNYWQWKWTIGDDQQEKKRKDKISNHVITEKKMGFQNPILDYIIQTN